MTEFHYATDADGTLFDFHAGERIALATVLGASLGTWLLVRKAQHEGAPIDLACAAHTPAKDCEAASLNTPRTEEAES